MARLNETTPLYGLVCAGGGTSGAYQVGVLKYIHEHFSRGVKSPFRAFAGASCGAYNTTFLAFESFNAHESALKLEKFWTSFHEPGYHQNNIKSLVFSLLKKLHPKYLGKNRTFSILDPAPLTKITGKMFIRANLEKAFQQKTTMGVAIAVTEILSGTPCWFTDGPAAVEWKRFHSIAIKDAVTSRHVIASSSVPFFLPPLKIGKHYFSDGGLNLERPFSTVLSYGATHILSISTRPAVPLELPRYHKDFKPRYPIMLRLMLNSVCRDASVSEAAQLDAFNRFTQTSKGKWPQAKERRRVNSLFESNASPYNYQPAKIFLMHPSKSLETLYQEIQKDKKKTERDPTTRIFLFQRDLIQKLIKFGYDDSKRRHDELKTFFNSSRK